MIDYEHNRSHLALAVTDHGRLWLEVDARNKVHKACNQAAAKLRVFFGERVGSRVINADGSLSKKVRHEIEMEMLFRADDNIWHWFETCSHAVRFSCKASYVCNNVHYYVAASTCVANIDKACVVPFIASTEPLKDDYTVESVLAGRKKMDELERELRLLKRDVELFRGCH